MMDVRTAQVQVHPGDGIVAALGPAVVVVAAGGRSAEVDGGVDALLGIVEGELATDGTTPGRRIARRLAGLLARDDRLPPFCLLAQADTGVAVLVHGPMVVDVDGPDGTERLSGENAATWVDRIVPCSAGRLVATAASTEAPPDDPRLDLRSGVVRGGGASLVVGRGADGVEGGSSAASRASAVRRPHPDLPPPATVAAPAVLRSNGSAEGTTSTAPATVAVAITTPDDASADGPPPAEVRGVARPPLPVATPDALAGPAVPAAPEVEGIVCSRGHFNDPASRYCAVCGISTIHVTHNLVSGPRPPLGVLVADDGATYPLDAAYVIGREPGDDDAVSAGASRPLRLDDPGRTLSRVHARILLSGWDVKVADAGSVNGTFVAPAGAADWTRLGTGDVVTLSPGTRVLVGDRTLAFDSHHRT